MNLKFFVALFTILIFIADSTDAAKTDVYRDALRNKNFTIKYSVVTPPVYQGITDAVLTPKGLAKKGFYAQSDMLHEGIVVVSGEDKYTEIFRNKNLFNVPIRIASGETRNSVSELKETGVCRLKKNGETFNFFYEVEGGQKKYYGGYGIYGGKSSSVEADKSIFSTPYMEMIEEYNFGSPALADALAAILPPENVIAFTDTPEYKFLNSGSLGNGLAYEDFISNKNGVFSAVRYYFNGDKLVKIASVSYAKSGDKITVYKKAVLDVKEFLPTAEGSYLSLPGQLKDKTKRNTEEQK